ncbi:hypothetical protein X797_004854 [Metarhizium robertsii]|uniref:Uncharacterized protein n=2 Tax=Metarhizium robertsii TaxID=568076 RepID=E9EMX9_METRA|nr:uncharacterized protein MAA_00730 [Metarhizium robertsii ARSEF 23]EFZ03656.1 hypothetical protein MAA_00730 [Metarhizium robertsii ARSEF 23]EXV02018.1 hypothetical protein X797_004854 [Metarhizium robertsii]
MKFQSLLAATIMSSPVMIAIAAPVGPLGPCPDSKIDAILIGRMKPEECCSYGICKGDVVISVGE